MTKLGRSKGYRLVGTHRFGFNAFFVKNGILDTCFPRSHPNSALTIRSPRPRRASGGQRSETETGLRYSLCKARKRRAPDDVFRHCCKFLSISLNRLK
jgi:hypothetical protein